MNVKDMSPEQRSEYFRELRKKVKKPGFASMDKDKHVAISKQAAYKRWHKHEEAPDTPPVGEEG